MDPLLLFSKKIIASCKKGAIIESMEQTNKSKNLGILFIICSAFFFALMNLFVKLAGDVPTMQKAFFRNAVALVSSLFVLLKNRENLIVPKGSMKYVLFRCIAGTLGIICNFYAIGKLPIADASILNKLSPFFAIVFSVFALKEKPTKLDWIAVCVAFGGALLVMKPTFSAEAIPAISGFLGGLGAGLAYTFLRKATSMGVKGPFIVFFFSFFSCIALSPALIFNYHPMTTFQLISLILAGVGATGGQFFITAAYAKAPAKEISVYDYTIVLFTALFGVLFLNELPDLLSFIGYAVIIGISIFKWLYTKKHNA